MIKEFELIAHRGASSLCPENTRSAFLKALELGSTCIETDLRLTRDGAWAVIHDENLRRFGGENRKVEDMTLAELRQYEYGSWFSEAFRGEALCTLEEVCALVLPQASLILDIKTKGRAEELASSLAAALAGQDPGRLILSSFSIPLLAALAKKNACFRLGYLFKNASCWRTWLASQSGCYSIHPRRDIFSAELAERARRQGMKVFVWTVNHPEEMRDLRRAGADGIFTDFPQRAMSAFAALDSDPAVI